MGTNKLNKPSFINKLYLGSQSKPRQHLLQVAKIPYKVLDHKSNETIENKNLPFNNYVLEIAKHKMKNLTLPNIHTINNIEKGIFVLTADTLMRIAKNKTILEKPKDKNDAKRMLKLIQNKQIELETGCCLEHKIYKNNKWQTKQHKYWTTPALLEFCVEDKEIDTYLKNVPQALFACGAGVIEEFGLNFLKSINGSFTTIIGLPLFELRHALKEISFFD